MPCARGRRPGREDTGHCHRPWQPTGRRCPERQPSWLPACRETRKQTSDSKQREKAECCRLQREAGDCSCLQPLGRNAFFISYKEVATMETICSSGAAGSLLPTPAFPRTASAELGATWWRGTLGGAGQGTPAHASRAGMAGVQVPARTRSALRQLPAPHTHSHCFPHRQRGRRAPFLFHPGGAGMSCTWMVKAAFSPSCCEERSPGTASARERAAQHLPSALSWHPELVCLWAV